MIESRADNIKITQPEDLALAAHYLARVREEESPRPTGAHPEPHRLQMRYATRSGSRLPRNLVFW